MNKARLIFEVIFYTSGTLILLIVAFFVGTNFVSDSRAFNTNEVVESVPLEISDHEENVVLQSKSDNDDGSFKTVEYKRTPQIEKEMREAYLVDEDMDVNTKSDNKSTVEETKYRVEIINYSGVPELTSFVSEILEAKGYIVSVTKKELLRKVDSIILERKENDVGKLVKRILRINKIESRTDLNSDYDVTIIIGNNYDP